MATRSGASGASQQSNGSRVAEFQRVVNAATDCTAIVGDNETCAGEKTGHSYMRIGRRKCL